MKYDGFKHRSSTSWVQSLEPVEPQRLDLVEGSKVEVRPGTRELRRVADEHVGEESESPQQEVALWGDPVVLGHDVVDLEHGSGLCDVALLLLVLANLKIAKVKWVLSPSY